MGTVVDDDISLINCWMQNIVKGNCCIHKETCIQFQRVQGRHEQKD